MSYLYKDAPLYRPNENAKYGNWYDATQGSLGNCYFVASLSSVSTKSDRLLSVLNGQKENKAGIYTFQFHIRGKPWLITIDDELLYEWKNDDNGKPNLFFLKLNENDP